MFQGMRSIRVCYLLVLLGRNSRVTYFRVHKRRRRSVWALLVFWRWGIERSLVLLVVVREERRKYPVKSIVIFSARLFRRSDVFMEPN